MQQRDAGRSDKAAKDAPGASVLVAGALSAPSRDAVSSLDTPARGFPQVLSVPHAAAPGGRAEDRSSRGSSGPPEATHGEDSSFPPTGAAGSRTRGAVTSSRIKVLSLPAADRGARPQKKLSRPSADLLGLRRRQWVDIRELRQAASQLSVPLILPRPAQAVGDSHPHDALQASQKAAGGLPRGFVLAAPPSTPASAASGLSTAVFAPIPGFPSSVTSSPARHAARALNWHPSVAHAAAPGGHLGLCQAQVPRGAFVYFLPAGVATPTHAAGLDPSAVGAAPPPVYAPFGAAALPGAREAAHGFASSSASLVHSDGGRGGLVGSREGGDPEGLLQDGAAGRRDGEGGFGGEVAQRGDGTEALPPRPVVPRLMAHVALMQQLMPGLLDARVAFQLQSLEALNALLLHSNATLVRWFGEVEQLAALSGLGAPFRAPTDVEALSALLVSSVAGGLPPQGLDCLFMSVRVSLLHLLAGDLLTSAEVAIRCAAIRCLAALTQLAATSAAFAGAATLEVALRLRSAPPCKPRRRARAEGDSWSHFAGVLAAASRAKEELAARTKQRKKSALPRQEREGRDAPPGRGRGGKHAAAAETEAGSATLWTEAEIEACEGVSTVVRCCLTLLCHMTGDGSTEGRMAALSAFRLLVPCVPQDMALASLQRPSFPPVTPNPLARIRGLLNADLTASTETALSAARGANLLPPASPAQQLASRGSFASAPSAEGASPLASLASVARALAAAGEQAHGAHHTVVGRELQSEVSKSPLPVAWLLLALDDSDFQVRQAAFGLLRCLLERCTREEDTQRESAQKTQQGSNSFPQVVQLLIWDCLSDPVQAVQASAAAVLPPLSLLLPLRDGAFRRAIFPLLHAKRKSTRLLFLQTLPLCKTLNARALKVEVQGLLRCPYSREDEQEVGACFAEVVFAAYHDLWTQFAAGASDGAGEEAEDESRSGSQVQRGAVSAEEARKKEAEMLQIFRILTPAKRRKRTQLALATNWARKESELRLLPLMRRGPGASQLSLAVAGNVNHEAALPMPRAAAQARRHASGSCQRQSKPTDEAGHAKKRGDGRDEVAGRGEQDQTQSQDRERHDGASYTLSPGLLLRRKREEDDIHLAQVLPLDVQLSLPETALQFSLALQRVLPTDSIERQVAAADCLLSLLEEEGGGSTRKRLRSASPFAGEPPPTLQRRDSDMSVESEEGGDAAEEARGVEGGGRSETRGDRETAGCTALAARQASSALQPSLPRGLEKIFPRPAKRRCVFSRFFRERQRAQASDRPSQFSFLARRACWGEVSDDGEPPSGPQAPASSPPCASSFILLNGQVWRTLHSEVPCRAGVCRQALRSIRPLRALASSWPFLSLRQLRVAQGAPCAEPLPAPASFETEEESLFRFCVRRRRERAQRQTKRGKGDAASKPRGFLARRDSKPRKAEARKSACDAGSASSLLLPLLPSPSLSDALVLAALERDRRRRRAPLAAAFDHEMHAEGEAGDGDAVGTSEAQAQSLLKAHAKRESANVLPTSSSLKLPLSSLFSLEALKAKKPLAAPAAPAASQLKTPDRKEASSSFSSASSASSLRAPGGEEAAAPARRDSEGEVSAGASARRQARRTHAAVARAVLAIRSASLAPPNGLARGGGAAQGKRFFVPSAVSLSLLPPGERGGAERARKKPRRAAELFSDAEGEQVEPGLWEDEEASSSWLALLPPEANGERRGALDATLEVRPPAWSTLVQLLSREGLLHECSLLSAAMTRFRRKRHKQSRLRTPSAGNRVSTLQLRRHRGPVPCCAPPSLSAPPSGCGPLSSAFLAQIYVTARRREAAAALGGSSAVSACLPRSFVVWRNVLVCSRLQALAATALLASPSLVVSPQELLPHTRLFAILSAASFRREFLLPSSGRRNALQCGRKPTAERPASLAQWRRPDDREDAGATAPASPLSASPLSFPFSVSLACPHWEATLEAYIHQSVVASTGLAALLPLDAPEQRSWGEGWTAAKLSCAFSPSVGASGKLELAKSAVAGDMPRQLLAEALADLVPRPLRFPCSRGAAVWLEATIDVFFDWGEEGPQMNGCKQEAERSAPTADASVAPPNQSSKLNAQVANVALATGARGPDAGGTEAETAGPGTETLCRALSSWTGHGGVGAENAQTQGHIRTNGSGKASRPNPTLFLCVRGPTPFEVATEARRPALAKQGDSAAAQVAASPSQCHASSLSPLFPPACSQTRDGSTGGVEDAGGRGKRKWFSSLGHGRLGASLPPSSSLVRAAMAGTTRNVTSFSAPFSFFEPRSEQGKRALVSLPEGGVGTLEGIRSGVHTPPWRCVGGVKLWRCRCRDVERREDGTAESPLKKAKREGACASSATLVGSLSGVAAVPSEAPASTSKSPSDFSYQRSNLSTFQSLSSPCSCFFRCPTSDLECSNSREASTLFGSASATDLSQGLPLVTAMSSVLPFFAPGGELASFSPCFPCHSQFILHKEHAGAPASGAARAHHLLGTRCTYAPEAAASGDALSLSAGVAAPPARRVKMFRIQQVEKTTTQIARARVTFPLVMDAATSGPFPVDLVVCALRTESEEVAELDQGSSPRCTQDAFQGNSCTDSMDVLVSVSDAKRLWLQPAWD
ncbi:hypothetical protein BESB_019530 [Besnoitia besnoiti]|uniref:HEAT repeat-containing protein n=1 Tax=Besnoitia besnoiti TaxID=94643 RepID=A0A2A9M9F6_BESBE|nr:hypothetical protein BESB_019530 [Besnoitia besnoiti]PFH32012.1 hypothetical protein BESB_019530 [Besnoitia besnoiti]